MHRQSGFTLIEVIAVLILIGLLAAVALPRYAGLQQQARQSAAQAAVAEAKARLSGGYGLALLQNSGATPGITNILSQAGFTSGQGLTVGDFYLTPTANGDTSVSISVSQVSGVALGTLVASTWDKPN